MRTPQLPETLSLRVEDGGFALELTEACAGFVQLLLSHEQLRAHCVGVVGRFVELGLNELRIGGRLGEALGLCGELQTRPFGGA